VAEDLPKLLRNQFDVWWLRSCEVLDPNGKERRQVMDMDKMLDDVFAKVFGKPPLTGEALKKSLRKENKENE
jgi:hypothetical protein